MRKTIIAVDLDDVLGDENTSIRYFINERHGFSHTPEDYDVIGEYGPYWWNIWGVSEEVGLEWYTEFVEAKVRDEIAMEVIPGAIEVLKHLEKSYELVIVSSRQPEVLAVTERWLEQYYPKVFKDVHFVEIWGNGKKISKAQICQEIGASYLIDDNANHCTVAQEAGLQGLLFGDYGWNRAVKVAPGVVRVRDWQAVREYFDDGRG